MKNSEISIDRSAPAVTRLTWCLQALPERGQTRSTVGVHVLMDRPPVDIHWSSDGVIELVSPSKQALAVIDPFPTDPRCSCAAANLPARAMGPSSGADQRVHYTRQFTPPALPACLDDVACVIEFDNPPVSSRG